MFNSGYKKAALEAAKEVGSFIGKNRSEATMIGEKDYLTADIHKTEWTSVLIENISENKTEC